MPFTPIHFGPGVLLKAVAPSRFSFTAFVLANVVIDLEPLYHILRGDHPLHGPLHSLVGATMIGLLAGVGVSLIPQVARRAPLAQDTPSKLPDALQAELRLSACVLGGVVGGASHALLDAFIYSDFHPFLPFSGRNPLLGSITPNSLTQGLLVAGAIGVALLAVRALLARRAG